MNGVLKHQLKRRLRVCRRNARSERRRLASRRPRHVALGAAALALLAGCRDAAPPLTTWPVHGSVVDRQGQPITSGAVRLMTDEDSLRITSAAIGADGAFEAQTQRSGFFYDGAVEGSYRAVVMTAKRAADGTLSPVQFHVPEPVRVKAGDNQIDLKVPL